MYAGTLLERDQSFKNFLWNKCNTNVLSVQYFVSQKQNISENVRRCPSRLETNCLQNKRLWSNTKFGGDVKEGTLLKLCKYHFVVFASKKNQPTRRKI